LACKTDSFLHYFKLLIGGFVSVVMQLTVVESALSSLQEAITTAPELYGLPKQMQQLSKVNY